MNQQLYSNISASVPARTRTITSTRAMNNTMSSSSSFYSSTAPSIVTATMPSYEGFQPPFDNSQQECCSASSSSSSSPMFPSYEDHHHHEEQHNMLMDNNKPSTITTSNVNNTNMSDSTMSTTTSSSKNNATTTTPEFKATFYNPFETKHRRRTSKQQFKILEGAFEENAKPSAAKRQALADELQMTPRGVQIWFQNRRAKAKQRIDHINISSSNTSSSCSNNSSSNNKRSFDDSSSTLDEEDEYNTHQHRRRRTTSNYNKPFYTEWDSQEPIVINDGTTTNHTTSTTTATTTTTTTTATAAITTTNADADAAATMSSHVTTSTPASPPCINGIHPVQAPSLCYSYSDASSSPVTPSVPSPTMQDQQEYQSQQPQLQSELSHQQQQQQPGFLFDYAPKSMWSPMDDVSFVEMDNIFGNISIWMQAVPPRIRPPLRQDTSIDSIATTASGFGPEEDEILSQWASKDHQVASFPNSPQQSQEQNFSQPIIHNTADNKDNSIALAPVFDVSSVMDSTISRNFVPAPNVIPWIPQPPQPGLVTW